jgi:hypothetical protein
MELSYRSCRERSSARGHSNALRARDFIRGKVRRIGAITGAALLMIILSAAARSTTTAPPENSTQSGNSAPLNPPYMKEFPTVNQILEKVKGSDAADTTNRQLGAFRQFKQVVQDLADTRGNRVQFTADENRIVGEYNVAYYKIAQPLNFPLDGYFGRSNFIDSLFTMFSMTQVRALWEKQNAAFFARHSGTQPPPSSTSSQPTVGLPPTNDPTALASRRCLELGGSSMDCIGSAFSTGMFSLLGINMSALDTTKSTVTGLRMTGTYKSSSGVVFTFSDGTVGVDFCGKLVGAGHKYSVQKLGNQIAIKIEALPQPILVGLGSDGKISGPAAVDVAGQVIIRYDSHMEELVDSRTSALIPGSAHMVQTPVYAPKTERCSIATMNPGPATPPDNGLLSEITSMASQLFSNGAAPQSQENWISPGPRFLGTYSSAGGLKAQFSDSNVILDCGPAHVAALYQVSNTANGVTISVRSGSSPFALTLQPNGMLNGPGTVTVNGRTLVGMNGDNTVFTPTNASCAVGTMNLAK